MSTEVPAFAEPREKVLFSPYRYTRRKTRVVLVGHVGVGGANPIRVQSMTTTLTKDTAASVDQVKKLADVGCEIARLTAPTVIDARNLENIKNELIKAGYTIPLVADIHFRPDAALQAAEFVEKVRINPGNFVDGKAFKVWEYTDEQYNDELDRLEEKFTPLVLKMKKFRRAMRIGTNHGSLSDRILNRYGDTPLGMVESALEFTRICRKNDFHDIIFSMKASNPKVMIEAYRLLAERLDNEGWDYPFHLGVTEAGDGPDGRIKSAVGIGSLLEDGLGDTIRVSLTEDPEFEIPVAKEIASYYMPFRDESIDFSLSNNESYVESRVAYSKRPSSLVMSGPLSLGGVSPVRVVSPLDLKKNSASFVLQLLEERLKLDTPPEILVLPFSGKDFKENYRDFRAGLIKETSRLSFWVSFEAGQFPTRVDFPADGFEYKCNDFIRPSEFSDLLKICKTNNILLILKSSSIKILTDLLLQAEEGAVPVVASLEASTLQSFRVLTAALKKAALSVPLVLNFKGEVATLKSAVVLGGLLTDGIGDAISISYEPLSTAQLNTAYNLLQACGTRTTKTEYVSCPSCGRTLFDLQSTTERIKSKTGHLKGVKIAIMGCIVNGPGEMADADFGYVGGGPGKINLYVGKTCVEKSIPMEFADGKLIELIKSHGKWVEPLIKK